MPTTTYMSLVTPTEGGSSGTWDTLLATLFDLIDSHRHTTGEGRQVTAAGISIDANLSFAGWIPTNVGAIGFAERIAGATPTIPNQSLWVSSTNDDLYFRSAGGVDNRLTVGGVLNVALVGGITGDYASAGAVFSYDDANKRYKAMRSQSPDYWAAVACGDLELLEKASGISNKVTLKSPAALAASYVNTWPAALPAGKRAVQCSAAGALTYDNAFSGAATFDSTLGVTGLITATAGLTAAANQHVTVSGTGELKHGDRVMTVHASLGTVENNWTAISFYLASSGLGRSLVPLQFREGDRIKSITFGRYGNASANLTTYCYAVTAAGTTPSIGSVLDTAPAAAWADTTLNVTDTTLAAGEAIVIEFNASATGLRVGTIRVTYDRP